MDINPKSAKALELTMPQSLLATADGDRISLSHCVNLGWPNDAMGHQRPICDGPAVSASPSIATTGYSITSSAIAITPDGISRPSDLAVERLITNSVLVDCWTGRSLGLSPLRMRPA
jgi:hypothetical protein